MSVLRPPLPTTERLAFLPTPHVSCAALLLCDAHEDGSVAPPAHSMQHQEAFASTAVLVSGSAGVISALSLQLPQNRDAPPVVISAAATTVELPSPDMLPVSILALASCANPTRQCVAVICACGSVATLRVGAAADSEGGENTLELLSVRIDLPPIDCRLPWWSCVSAAGPTGNDVLLCNSTSLLYRAKLDETPDPSVIDQAFRVGTAASQWQLLHRSESDGLLVLVDGNRTTGVNVAVIDQRVAVRTVVTVLHSNGIAAAPFEFTAVGATAQDEDAITVRLVDLNRGPRWCEWPTAVCVLSARGDASSVLIAISTATTPALELLRVHGINGASDGDISFVTTAPSVLCSKFTLQPNEASHTSALLSVSNTFALCAFMVIDSQESQSVEWINLSNTDE